MEFHVWDFNPRIEVRFNQEYINKIRSLTVTKKIHIKSKPYMVPGWKQPHSRDFIMEKEVKVVPFTLGHPMHKIAERLYAPTDWHGPDRPVVKHRPFITIKEFQKLHEVTGLPLEEMEANVIEVRNWWAGHREIPMKFPVKANTDWAWLFGLWFSSGGLITRNRVGSSPRHEGFRIEERTVRIRVDVRVFEEKVQPLLSRIAYVPELGYPWYMKYGGHKIDTNTRKGVGNLPRKVFYLVRPIREIMEKFGLPTEERNQHDRIGCRIPSRRFKLIIPEWVLKSKENLHSFIEGYINGSQIGSWFHRAYGEKHLSMGVEARISGEDEQEALDFLGIFEEYLTSLGITGTFHCMPKYTSPFFWFGYHIFKHSALAKLYEMFDIRKPDLRARLILGYFMNALLYEACKELTSAEALVLGALLEKPMTSEEIINAFRFRAETVASAIRKMQKLCLVAQCGDRLHPQRLCWIVRPTGYRDYLVKRLWAEERLRRRRLMVSGHKFYSKCDRCGNVVDSHIYRGKCGCGGRYKPVPRHEVLKKTIGPGYISQIAKVSNLTLPSINS